MPKVKLTAFRGQASVQVVGERRPSQTDKRNIIAERINQTITRRLSGAWAVYFVRGSDL